MLVLKRKAGEAIIIGDNIEIRVLRMDGENVRLGIIAPQMVTVLRSELLEEVRSETKASAVAEAKLNQIQLLSQRLKGQTAAVKEAKKK